MNSRDLFVLAVVEQTVLLGILLYLLGAWVLSRRDKQERRRELPRLEPFDRAGSEAKPQQPFVEWVNSLPRLGEEPTSPIRPFRHDGVSAHVRD